MFCVCACMLGWKSRWGVDLVRGLRWEVQNWVGVGNIGVVNTM